MSQNRRGHFAYPESTMTRSQSGATSTLPFFVPKEPIQPGWSRGEQSQSEMRVRKPARKKDPHLLLLQRGALKARFDRERSMKRRIRFKQFIKELGFWAKLSIGSVVVGALLALYLAKPFQEVIQSFLAYIF